MSSTIITESTENVAARALDPQQQFMQAFRGSFTSALRWHHLDALWQRLNERSAWAVAIEARFGNGSRSCA